MAISNRLYPLSGIFASYAFYIRLKGYRIESSTKTWGSISTGIGMLRARSITLALHAA
jgi:hypothetical protein